MNKLNYYLLVCLFIISSQCFGQQFPGLIYGGDKNEQGISLDITNDNGYILLGNTRSEGEGSNDIYLIKLNDWGQVEWSETFGWCYHDFGLWVEQTDDNGFIIAGNRWGFGYGGEDIVLIKTDMYGNEIWSNFYGYNHQDQGFCVKELSDGGFILLGYSKSFEPNGDFYVVRVDAEGNKLWSYNYGSEYVDYGFEIIPTENNCFIMIGSKGGFYNVVAGDFKSHDADILIIKIDESGNELWRQTYGGTSHDFGMSIKPSGDNGYYCFGSTQSYGAGSFDAYLLKIDNEGNELWSKTFGGDDFEYGASMDISDDGNLYLLGTTNSFVQNNCPDLYLIKTNSNGEEIWSLTVGGEYSDYGYSVKATHDGGCAFIGEISSEGNINMYFVKVDSLGNFELFSNFGKFNYAQDNVILYPNPMTDKATIKIENQIATNGFKLQIYNSLGQLVRTVENINSSKYQLKRDGLSPGTYVYVIRTNEKKHNKFSGKFIVK